MTPEKTRVCGNWTTRIKRWCRPNTNWKGECVAVRRPHLRVKINPLSRRNGPKKSCFFLSVIGSRSSNHRGNIPRCPRSPRSPFPRFRWVFQDVIPDPKISTAINFGPVLRDGRLTATHSQSEKIGHSHGDVTAAIHLNPISSSSPPVEVPNGSLFPASLSANGLSSQWCSSGPNECLVMF